MQHHIAGCDIMLLGETIRLLTPSSHLGEKLPRRSQWQILLADLLCHYGPRIQCYRRVGRRAIVGLKLFYPSQEGAFCLSATLDPLFVTHPAGIRAH